MGGANLHASSLRAPRTGCFQHLLKASSSLTDRLSPQSFDSPLAVRSLTSTLPIFGPNLMNRSRHPLRHSCSARNNLFFPFCSDILPTRQ